MGPPRRTYHPRIVNEKASYHSRLELPLTTDMDYILKSSSAETSLLRYNAHQRLSASLRYI